MKPIMDPIERKFISAAARSFGRLVPRAITSASRSWVPWAAGRLRAEKDSLPMQFYKSLTEEQQRNRKICRAGGSSETPVRQQLGGTFVLTSVFHTFFTKDHSRISWGKSLSHCITRTTARR